MAKWTKDERAIAALSRNMGAATDPALFHTVEEWAEDLEWDRERTRKALFRLWKRGRLMQYSDGKVDRYEYRRS